MIKAQDLRVGNNALYFNKLWIVEPQDFIYCDLSKADGIPLTPEILESAGFEKWGNSRTYSREFINGDTIQITGNEVFLGGSEACIDAHGFTTSNIDYLHQLQNIYYALTGSELEIKAMTPSASQTS